MTKDEFKKLYEIHKREWESLALTGNSSEPESMEKFDSYCVACEIESRVCLLSDEDISGECCCFCPVAQWRNPGERDCLCTENKDSYYRNWLKSTTVEENKFWAKKISELKFKWMDVYEKIDVRDLID